MGTLLPGSTTQSMTGGDPSFGQKAVGAGLLGMGVYGAGTSSGLIGSGAGALVSNPVGATIAAGLALASLFD
jgi:hypothetical protein